MIYDVMLSFDYLTVDSKTIFISDRIPRAHIKTTVDRKTKFQKTSSRSTIISNNRLSRIGNIKKIAL
jgi:hypothetical protein